MSTWSSGSRGTSRQRQSEIAAKVDALTDAMRELVADLRPEDIPRSWASEVLNAFVEAERAASAGRLLITNRAASTEKWKKEGFASAADWLAFHQGREAARARNELEASRRLEQFNKTADALRGGDISTDEAGVIAGAAEINPDAEQDLIDLAGRESMGGLKGAAARRKAEAEAEQNKREREAKIRKERMLRVYADDGIGKLFAMGPLADIAAIEAAIEQIVGAKLRHSARAAVEGAVGGEGAKAAAFDALVDLANASLGGTIPGDVTNGDEANGEGAECGDGVASSPGAKRSTAKPLMLVRADQSALVRGYVSEGELCEITGLGPISVAEARRMLGESVLSLIVSDGQAVANVVNFSRKPSVAQQLAKLWEQPHCAVANCNRTINLQYDHRADWAETQETISDGLDRLCRHHHDLKTYHGWQLEPGVGRRKMLPPDDDLGRTSAKKRQERRARDAHGGGADTRAQRSEAQRPAVQLPEAQRPGVQRPEAQRPGVQAPEARTPGRRSGGASGSAQGPPGGQAPGRPPDQLFLLE